MKHNNITITIHGGRLVSAFTVNACPGLAIYKNTRQGWVFIHVASGLEAGRVRGREIALRALLELNHVNWTLTEHQLRTRYRRLAATVGEAVERATHPLKQKYLNLVA